MQQKLPENFQISDQGVRSKFYDLMAAQQIQVSDKDQFIQKDMML